MYKLICFLSYIIRQFFLPNPFSNLFNNQGTADIVNYIFGGVLVPLTYLLTGSWYHGGAGIIGSIGFFINYLVLTGIFLLITYFIKIIWLAIVVFIIVYIILCIFENWLLDR